MSKSPFNVGDKVVYPGHGGCIIAERTHVTYHGTSTTMLRVAPLVATSTTRLFVPAHNPEKLRPVVSKTELEKVLQVLTEHKPPRKKQWGRAKENLKDKLLCRDLSELCAVVASIYSQSGARSFNDIQFCTQAIPIIASEVALVLDVNLVKAQDLVERQLTSHQTKANA